MVLVHIRTTFLFIKVKSQHDWMDTRRASATSNNKNGKYPHAVPLLPAEKIRTALFRGEQKEKPARYFTLCHRLCYLPPTLCRREILTLKGLGFN